MKRQQQEYEKNVELDPSKEANYKIDEDKYDQLFPNDRRQVKLVVRHASKQPWLTARQVFFVVGLMTMPVVAYSTWRLPQKMARIFFLVPAKIFSTERKFEESRIFRKGRGAVLAFNHCSWLDGVTILSLQPFKARTIAWSGNFKHPIMKWWAKFFRCYPDQWRPQVHSKRTGRSQTGTQRR